MVDVDSFVADARKLGLALVPELAGKLLAYLSLLQRWNATYNLTAVRDPSAMYVQHLLDCLAAVVPLRQVVGDRHARIADVGSGAGLPGVLIAAICGQLDVSCIDTVGKKVAFVRQVGVELGLCNLRAEHGRVESLQPAAPFDVITSRAFASLGDFIRLTRPLLSSGGAWMAMKGKTPFDEIEALPSDVEVFHVEHLHVPRLEADRCLVWLRRR
jgi:16S rRNA (guanine527-N7)-methyltransferase